MQVRAQGAGTKAASPGSFFTAGGETQPGKRQAEAGLSPACAETCSRAEGLRDAVCSTGTAQPQGQREGQVSLSRQSSALALPRTRGGRASSWVPNPLCPQHTRWMLMFPKEWPLPRLPPSRWGSQMWLQTVPCCRAETASDPTCPLHQPAQRGCQPGRPVYWTRGRLGPKDNELGCAGDRKGLPGYAQKWESVKAAGWALRQGKRWQQGTVKLGTGRAEAE